jgi:hypothetical protein
MSESDREGSDNEEALARWGLLHHKNSRGDEQIYYGPPLYMVSHHYKGKVNNKV